MDTRIVLDEYYTWDAKALEAVHAWLAGDDSKISKEDLDAYKAIVFSPEADEIQSIAATELGATA